MFFAFLGLCSVLAGTWIYLGISDRVEGGNETQVSITRNRDGFMNVAYVVRNKSFWVMLLMVCVDTLTHSFRISPIFDVIVALSREPGDPFFCHHSSFCA